MPTQPEIPQAARLELPAVRCTGWDRFWERIEEATSDVTEDCAVDTPAEALRGALGYADDLGALMGEEG